LEELSPANIEVHSFTHDFDLSTFRCEKQRFEDYLRNEAEIDERSKIGRVFLFVHKHTKHLVGFVTLAMSHLPKDKHAKLQNLTTHGNIPGMLLGQIARHEDYRSMRAGKYILDWVIDHAMKQALEVGCRLIIVSSDLDKVKWYTDNGFILINGSKTKMFFDLLTQRP
jgi:hypothetical protein